MSAPVAELAGSVCDLCRTDRHATTVLEAGDYEYGVRGRWSLARCAACGLFYQAPRPAAAEIPAFYPPSYAVYGDDPVVGWLFKITYWLDARRVAGLIGPSGRVLDVGCGAGGALVALAGAGKWEVCGLELDVEAARRAAAQGFNVRQGDLVDTDFEPGSFDLIRMGHVIEHVRDPIATLRRAWELLKPGGTLFGETPNIDCLDFRIFGRYWGALHFPRHIALFTPETMTQACERVGFEGVRITPRLRTVGWSAGIQNWLADRAGLRVPANGRVRWYPLLIAPFLPVTVLQALLSRTATMAFVAKKPAR